MQERRVGRMVTETLITCPTRGVPVPSGVELGDLAEPARIYMLVRGAGCGGDHLWSPEDSLEPL